MLFKKNAVKSKLESLALFPVLKAGQCYGLNKEMHTSIRNVKLPGKAHLSAGRLEVQWRV